MWHSFSESTRESWSPVESSRDFDEGCVRMICASWTQRRGQVSTGGQGVWHRDATMRLQNEGRRREKNGTVRQEYQMGSERRWTMYFSVWQVRGRGGKVLEWLYQALVLLPWNGPLTAKEHQSPNVIVHSALADAYCAPRHERVQGVCQPSCPCQSPSLVSTTFRQHQEVIGRIAADSVRARSEGNGLEVSWN